MTPRSLSELLEIYQAWSSRQTLETLAHAAADRGDADTADVFHSMIDDERAVSALDALTAQRELADLLHGWEWQTVRAARDAGAGWDEIGRITQTDASTAQQTYREKVERQAAMSAGYGWEFDAGYQAAVGDPAVFPAWDAVDNLDAPAARPEDEPVPFLLTSQGYDATRTDGETDERGLTGGEGPVLSGGPTVSAEDAAHALTTDGRTLGEARAAVRAYQDSVTAQLGAPAHAWGLDSADLDEVRSSSTAIPLPRPSADDDRRAELASWQTTNETDDLCMERTDQ